MRVIGYQFAPNSGPLLQGGARLGCRSGCIATARVVQRHMLWRFTAGVAGYERKAWLSAMA